jgi:hypothetical protein
MPFSQCAQSRRLRVSMLIAMANNPEFRVIRVNDAALLDEDSIKEVDEFAKENDYQVFLECVGKGDGKGILLEANKVVSVDGEPQE